MSLAPGTYAVFTTTEGKITVRLFESDAPITVKNFIELAEGSKEWTHPTTHAKSTDKLFDGTIFHRVIPDFMIQGGDPTGTGMGGPGYRFRRRDQGLAAQVRQARQAGHGQQRPRTPTAASSSSPSRPRPGSPATTPSSAKSSKARTSPTRSPRFPAAARTSPKPRSSSSPSSSSALPRSPRTSQLTNPQPRLGVHLLFALHPPAGFIANRTLLATVPVLVISFLIRQGCLTLALSPRSQRISANRLRLKQSAPIEMESHPCPSSDPPPLADRLVSPLLCRLLIHPSSCRRSATAPSRILPLTPPSTVTPSSSPPRATCGPSTSTAAPRTASRPTPAPSQMPSFLPTERPSPSRANFEGPREVYTMPIDGGLPQRRTWDGDAAPPGWAPDGRLMVSTARYSTLPGAQLVLIDDHGAREIVPLAQAAEAAYSADGHTLFFTRWFAQWSETKRYKGGWAENLWRFDGNNEAVPLTADYAGTSAHPMFWNGRVYFLSDRDGVMNVYSIDAEGHDLKQESHQHVFDVAVRLALRRPHRLRLRLRPLAARPQDRPRRNHSHHPRLRLRPDARALGQEAARLPHRRRTSRPMAPAPSSPRAAKSSLSPQKPGASSRSPATPASAIAKPASCPMARASSRSPRKAAKPSSGSIPPTAKARRNSGPTTPKCCAGRAVPSPDGHWLAHRDKDQQLWIYDIKAKQDKRIAQSMNGDFDDLSWSPDSHWLAYV